MLNRIQPSTLQGNKRLSRADSIRGDLHGASLTNGSVFERRSSSRLHPDRLPFHFRCPSYSVSVPRAAVSRRFSNESRSDFSSVEISRDVNSFSNRNLGAPCTRSFLRPSRKQDFHLSLVISLDGIFLKTFSTRF